MKKLNFVRFPNRDEEIITVVENGKTIPNRAGLRSVGYLFEATEFADGKEVLSISTYGPNQNNFDSYAIVWYYTDV